MTPLLESTFKQDYQKHLQHLKLKGLQPKTIEAYSRAIRRIGKFFDNEINDLSEQQLLDYFVDLQDKLSWSAVKLDLYGLKFGYIRISPSSKYGTEAISWGLRSDSQCS